MKFLLNLPLTQLRFYFRAQQPIHLPWYKGATFRGAFGKTFKNLVCFREDKNCIDCLLANSCPYYYIFETPNQGELPDFNSQKVPQPFILSPPLTRQRYFQSGESFTLDLVIMGKAMNYLPYFIYVFDEMGRKRGVGKGRRQGFGKYSLEKVTELNREKEELIYKDKTILTTKRNSVVPQSDAVPENSEGSLLVINFLTPTRMTHGGLIEKTPGKQLTFPMVVEDLIWRIYLLYFFHHDNTIIRLGRDQLIEKLHQSLGSDRNRKTGDSSDTSLWQDACRIVNKNLSWKDWFHYSNRSKSRVPSGGFVGSVVFRGNWAPYYPFLKLGEKIHLGRSTTFGMGKFTVSMVNSS